MNIYSDYIERWNVLSARNEKEAFRKIAKMFSLTVEDKIDMRGFPFGKDTIRNTLTKLKFKNADLSYSNFINCNFFNLRFINCIFKKCNFTEVRQWETDFKNCEFIQCNFHNATMGVKCIYNNCNFINSKLIGRYFYFGTNSVFSNCNFKQCKIQSCEITSTTFNKCKFDSTFKRVRFLGKSIAEVEKKNDKRAYPTTILDCSFIGSKFINVEVFLDIIEKNNQWPLKEFEIYENKNRWYK